MKQLKKIPQFKTEDEEVYLECASAIGNVASHSYDAFIIQAALDLGCETLYGEDLRDGQQFGSLKVVNPFKP